MTHEKHMCPQCNIWIQGDRISIRNHESSQKHKDRVHKNAQHRAAGKAIADREEQEKQKELSQIERDARARFAMDMRGESVAPSPHIYDVPIGAGPMLPTFQDLEDDDDEIPPPPPPRKRTPPPPPPRPHYMQAAPPPVAHYYYSSAPPVVTAVRPAAPPPPAPVAFALKGTSKSKQRRPRPPPPPMPPPSSSAAPPPPPSSTSALPPPPPTAALPVDDIPPIEAEKSKGFYTVRGVVYLEGQAHESKLTKGKACEVWLDDDDAWVPVTITRIFTTTVHETQAKFKHFHVQRRDMPTAPPIENVRADALRIPLTMPVGMVVPTQADQTADFLHRLHETVSGTAPAAVVEQAPGYGSWSTVSVRVVDEVADAAARQAEVAAFEAQKPALQLERDNEMLMEESLLADNAMGAFNPWGGSYKGIALDDDTTKRADADDGPVVAAPVAFKSRAKKAMTRRRHMQDDDP
ncbi:Aste57867_10749 [Aphanomyces stellatus]|uniref:Aste57867_10749 protein n=1 Tax=Aphanomyces stellatus TaxID=120398 RepID=A0A485KST3_9STRA|nr:hypothetical protein As57867_010709 [Aphanomyces stellatus]VFT87619.1 Aste57867_10749 [Aphanomyces stellatus]